MESNVWYLELMERSQLVPSVIPGGLELRGVQEASVNARFYREVGSRWQWTDRLSWTGQQWENWVDRENLKTWIAHFEDEEAGYVEMEIQEGGNVEVVYFGLLPAMIGKGLGGGMLSLSVHEAWGIEGAQRVWLHTCSEDHPHALGNYEKRGFRLFRTEVV
ncbi:GNAT family N-acetyltransferase [bacterium]|nr:GNAT family N-acetyltransferase [bacterium]